MKLQFNGIKLCLICTCLMFMPNRVLAMNNDGFHQTGPCQAIAMRHLTAARAYGVLMVAVGEGPRFAALITGMTSDDCLSRQAMRVDGVVLLTIPQFYPRRGKVGLCELWLRDRADRRFFANRIENDHFIQIDGHDINVKNYHLSWRRIAGSRR
ncbi:hypothetical protein ACK323_10535 [Aeromonas enteropelogenes]|uniref:hypothetical protein n=1 Tax=Aeromonas enteropelogenes TaxID=29489 RepID=UPI0039897CF7